MGVGANTQNQSRKAFKSPFKMFMSFVPLLGTYHKEIILSIGKYGNVMKSKYIGNRLHLQLRNDSALANIYFTFSTYRNDARAFQVLSYLIVTATIWNS